MLECLDIHNSLNISKAPYIGPLICWGPTNLVQNTIGNSRWRMTKPIIHIRLYVHVEMERLLTQINSQPWTVNEVERICFCDANCSIIYTFTVVTVKFLALKVTCMSFVITNQFFTNHHRTGSISEITDKLLLTLMTPSSSSTPWIGTSWLYRWLGMGHGVH